ncbi:MAG: hypothetical protein ACU836_16995 [Gammaproteobacteria bacterium]
MRLKQREALAGIAVYDVSTLRSNGLRVFDAGMLNTLAGCRVAVRYRHFARLIPTASLNVASSPRLAFLDDRALDLSTINIK